MQKTTEGLGIMIIEGSHKAFGKGIFISDIQQNSLAFKACTFDSCVPYFPISRNIFLQIGNSEGGRHDFGCEYRIFP